MWQRYPKSEVNLYNGWYRPCLWLIPCIILSQEAGSTYTSMSGRGGKHDISIKVIVHVYIYMGTTVGWVFSCNCIIIENLLPGSPQMNSGYWSQPMWTIVGRNLNHHTLMSLSSPPDIICSPVSLKHTAVTWYVLLRVWAGDFFLISHT